MFHDLPQLVQPPMEGRQVGLVVHRRLVHMVQYLLQVPACQYGGGTIAMAVLTLMDAICEYVAGVSFVLPMVR